MFLRVFFLAFLFALDIDAGKTAWRASEVRGQRSAVRSVPRSQVELGNAQSSIRNSLSSLGSEALLPNSCEILAVEACARMRRAGIWTRVLIVAYEDRSWSHALCVFQPRKQICVYDDTGSVELDTDSRDPAAIANLLAIRKGWKIKSARFLK